MAATWLYVIGGIVIAVLAFTIGYRLVSVSITQAQKQGAIENFNELHTNIQNVCFQEVNNYVFFKMQVPNSVRVIYVTNETNSTLSTVVDKIKDKETSSGMNLCIQFQEEQELRCRELNCHVDLMYMGVLPKSLDIQMMVKKILGEAPVKDYEIYIKKTGGTKISVSDELAEDATPTTKPVPPTIPSSCPKKSFCLGAPEAEKKDGVDCCPKDIPICTNEHCCPNDKPKYCNIPKSGGARCMSESEYDEKCEVTVGICDGALPEKFDWRSYQGRNWLNPVRNQGKCGSCWTFSTAGMIENSYNVQYDKAVASIDLAEQDLLSCSRLGNCGMGGPIGGEVLTYIQNFGICEEDCFPYVASDVGCNRCSDYNQKLWTIQEFEHVIGRENIKRALACYGPLSIGVKPWPGSSPPSGHAVVLVGWDDTTSKWIIRNSWGAGWGDGGYGKLPYGKNQIEDHVSVVKGIKKK